SAGAAAAAGHASRAAARALAALAEFDPGDDERRVTTLLELFDYAWDAADVGTAERARLEVTPLLHDERSARAARAFAANALLRWHQGRYESAREAAVRAVEIARDCGAAHERARALTVAGQAHAHLGETNHAEESFAEAARIFE